MEDSKSLSLNDYNYAATAAQRRAFWQILQYYEGKMTTLSAEMENKMNVYEAYLAVKEGKIIRAKIGRAIHFILQTIEIPVNAKRIIRFDLNSACIGDKCPQQIGELDREELEEVCISSFAETAEFTVITLDELMQEWQKRWHEENCQVQDDD